MTDGYSFKNIFLARVTLGPGTWPGSITHSVLCLSELISLSWKALFLPAVCKAAMKLK